MNDYSREIDRARSLFELLETRDLIKSGSVCVRAIHEKSGTELIDIGRRLAVATEQTTPFSGTDLFAHSASIDLAGGRGGGCDGFGCRISKVDQLTRFAGLYSDHVVVNNYFTDYAHMGLKAKTAQSELADRFVTDVGVLLYVRPLLESGLISLYTPQTHLCPYCIAKSAFGSFAAKRLKREFRELEAEYFKRSVMTFEKDAEGYKIGVEGLEPYLGHKISYRSDTLFPPETTEVLAARLRKRGRVVLSGSLKRQTGIPRLVATRKLKTIAFEAAASQLFKTSFLTNSDTDIAILQSLTSDPEIANRNELLSEHMTSLVPFAEGVSIADLVKLRNREGEAFIRYRKCIGEAVEEVRSQKESFSASDAKSIYRDIIAPRIAELDQRVKNSTRDLILEPMKSVAATFGAISLGMYSGLLPPTLIPLAQTVGLIKISADVIEKALGALDTEGSIRNEELFFLWKVRKLANRKRR